METPPQSDGACQALAGETLSRLGAWLPAQPPRQKDLNLAPAGMFSFSVRTTHWSQAVSNDVTFLSPKSMHEPRGYSHAAKIGSGMVLFIAGQVPLDRDGHLVGSGDFRAQCQQVFENLRAAVEAAGGSFRNVVKLNVYVLDVSKLAEYREVRDRYIDVNHPPTSTVVQVAALFRSEFVIEVEAVAALQV
jgi:2-iminobutanoate/2-iminopropanoate deaminase